MFNYPYMPQAATYQPRQEVIRVNGRNGAESLQLQPNSSVLALDENEPIVWLAQSDGAGYKTVTAYRISPIKAPDQIDLSDIDARLKRLEELFNESDLRQAESPK